MDTRDIVTHAPELVQTAIDSFGRLDIVINNAGIARFGRMPHLIASGTGRLINISSSAMLGVPMASRYSAAKAAIWGLGNSFAMEAREFGVQVSTVQPSAWTSMTEAAFDNPAVLKVLREQLPPHAVSAFVTWLAHQDTTVYGECFQVSGVSAGRTTFAAMERIKIDEATPEAWAANAENLMRDRALTPLRNTDESFRAELVFLDPSMESEIPLDASSVAK
ncbi:SDR family NAD(P)-dependent oxidoreductase [Amycolatopsis thermoflava]|uniref:SDR family NAD(P)-dependent oxidoreductase n=1 Tax=Amycolatopsis thermoflava TaxID=84480 RepID=UPI0037F25601